MAPINKKQERKIMTLKIILKDIYRVVVIIKKFIFFYVENIHINLNPLTADKQVGSLKYITNKIDIISITK